MQIIRFGILRDQTGAEPVQEQTPSDEESDGVAGKLVHLDDYRPIQKYENPPWLTERLRDRRKQAMAMRLPQTVNEVDVMLTALADFFDALRAQGGTFATSKQKILLAGRDAHMTLTVSQLTAASQAKRRWLLEQLG